LSEEDKMQQENYFKKALMSSKPIGELKAITEWECWRQGKAEGKLIGGNLNVLCLLMGTPYFPNLSEFNGAILFWEDICKELHVIDQMLYKLRLAGVFDRISGMLIGVPTEFEEKEYAELAPCFKDLVLASVEKYDFPIISNMDFGHSTLNMPLIIGLNAKMDADNTTLYITESACID